MNQNSKYLNRIEHLSAQQIEELKSEYYSSVPIADILDKYKINVSPMNLWKTFPLVSTPQKQCKYCASVMYEVSLSRSRVHRNEYLCTRCSHHESPYGCSCKQCLREKAQQKEQQLIEQSLMGNEHRKAVTQIREYPGAPSLDMLSLREKAYLGALLRTSLHHDHLLLDLQSISFHNTAPTYRYTRMIVDTLLERNIITPYRLDDHEDKLILNRYIHGSLYDICISDDTLDKRQMIVSLMYPDETDQKDQAAELFREVNSYDAVNYLMKKVQQFNLKRFDPGERYIALFSYILQSYSLGQLLNFIYLTIKNQAAYTARNRYGLISLENEIFNQISKRFEKARSENWKVTNYNRSWEGEQSALSRLVSHNLLGVGERAFYQVIKGSF